MGSNILHIYIFGDIHAKITQDRFPRCLFGNIHAEEMIGYRPQLQPNKILGGFRFLYNKMLQDIKSKKQQDINSILLLHLGDYLDNAGLWGVDNCIIGSEYLQKLQKNGEIRKYNIPLISVIGNHDASFGYTDLNNYCNNIDPIITCYNIVWDNFNLGGTEYSFTLDGINVVILALTHKSIFNKIKSQEYPNNIINYKDPDPYSFTDLEQLISDIKKDLDKTKPNFFILLAHAGYNDGREVSFDQMKYLSESVDIIIDGHSHNASSCFMDIDNSKYFNNYINAGSHSIYYGQVIMKKEQDSNKVEYLYGPELIPVYFYKNNEDDLQIYNEYFDKICCVYKDKYNYEPFDKVGWLHDTLIYRGKDFYRYGHPFGTLLCKILYDSIIKDKEGSSNIFISALPSTLFNRFEILGILNSGKTVNDRNSILHNELNSVLRYNDSIIIADILSENWIDFFHQTNIRGIGTKSFLQFFGFELELNDTQPIFTFPKESQRISIITTQWFYKNIVINDEILKKITLSIDRKNHTIKDLMFEYFLKKSLEKSEYLSIPAPVYRNFAKTSLSELAKFSKNDYKFNYKFKLVGK